MTEKKWTPGPWSIGEVTLRSEIYRYEIMGEQGYCLVATSYGTTTGMADWYAGACHVKANAHLIAAAPELYEALAYARRFMKADQYDLEFIDAALDKARGEK